MFDFLAETLEADDIKIASGQTAALNWSRPETGVIVFEPIAGYEKNIVISVAVHGNETAPIEIVNKLVFDILNGQCVLNVRLMVVFGNLEAMRQGERYLNVDLNRLFSDHYLRYEACYETKRAAILQQVIADFYAKDTDKTRLHFDLHTAIRASNHATFGLLPYLQSGRYKSSMINWLKSVGLEALVVNHAPAATFSYFTSDRFSADSCTLELGKAKAFGQNDLMQFSGIEKGLFELITGESPDVNIQAPLAVYKVADVLTKLSDQFKLNVADDVANFSEFPKGYVIASDYAPESGDDVLYEVQQQSGYILFPNRHVKNGLRAGLLLAKSDLSAISCDF